MPTSTLRFPSRWGLFGLAVAHSACMGDDPSPGSDGAPPFVSDDPTPDNSGGRGESGGTGGGAPTGGENDGGDTPPEREVSEADVVAVEGDRLYALSTMSGLTVLDISTPDAPRVLGRFRTQGAPFEMYVDAGQVFVMLNQYGGLEYDDEAEEYVYRSTSQLLTLDASNPSDIRVIGEHPVPGNLQDSRRVGDVLYLVTQEDGWCWGCEAGAPNTTVASFDIADRTNVLAVEQLRFHGDDREYSWRRSVSATDQRLYVAGEVWNGEADAHSIIEVVDIADPDGKLVAGARVPVAGQIQNRWQMDEYDGVLRVVSQPFTWQSTLPPRVETFAVTSSAKIDPLAQLDLKLPRPEALQSVRFDGPRGYAVTFERTDPLFTLDLVDPKAPKQMGELEIPGFLWHMEPRGNRLLALGFDRANPEGSVHVSLFDVADLAMPKMLSRVNFGGDWASFAEDQDRIHKAFSVDDDRGAIAVPFAGSVQDEKDPCSSEYRSGIQLVDFANDALTRRGVAEARGLARRALWHRDRLVAMSDQSVQVFDADDRDAPKETAEVLLAANAEQTVVSGDHLLRFGRDWWDGRAELEFVSLANAEDATPVGRLDLSDLTRGIAGDSDVPEFACGYGYVDLRNPVVHEGFVYLVYEAYEVVEPENGKVKSVVRVASIDARDPASPALVGTVDLPFDRNEYGSSLSTGSPEASFELLGSTLVFTRAEAIYDAKGENYTGAKGSFELVSLAEPGQPRHVGSIARKTGRDLGQLIRTPGALVSWRAEEVGERGSGRLAFYLERLVPGPDGVPELLPPVNVPGAVVAYDHARGRALTVDFDRIVEQTVDASACYTRASVLDYEENGSCHRLRRELVLVGLDGNRASRIDGLPLPDDRELLGLVMAGDTAYVGLFDGAFGYGRAEGDGVVGPGGVGQPVIPTHEVMAIRGLRGEALTTTRTFAFHAEAPWLWNARAAGNRLVLPVQSSVTVLDGRPDAAQPFFSSETYAFGCQSLTVHGNNAYCALGQSGVQVIALPPE